MNYNSLKHTNTYNAGKFNAYNCVTFTAALVQEEEEENCYFLEEGGSRSMRNVNTFLPDYTASNPRGQ
jgi:hypothetical protein